MPGDARVRGRLPGPPLHRAAGPLSRAPRAGAGVEPGELPCITWLGKQLDELESGQRGSPQKVYNMLVGRQRWWWECCQEAARHDPKWLFEPRTENIRRQIGKSAVRGGDTAADSMAAVADSVFVVARALSVPPDQAHEQASPLMRIARQWDGSGLLISSQPAGTGPVTGRGVPALEEGLARRLESVIAELQPSVGDVVTTSPAARSLVEITARLLAGADIRRRPVARVSVVFGSPGEGTEGESGKEQGVAGFLELREFPAGPPGLFPDPQAMAGARSNGSAFTNSLSHAWQSCPGGRCVLWRIILPDDPSSIPPIQGGSLGLAFALGLRALFRYPASRRPTLAWLRGFFHGLRPRTAVTGGIDERGHPQLVTDMGGKLSAAHRKRWRLVAPAANQADIRQAPDPSMVRFAATIKQADRYARQWRTGRLATAAALIATATTTGLVITHQEAAAANRQQTASRLAGISGSLLDSNVGLAELLAVQAYHYEPNPQTRAALFQAVTASPHLVRSIQASGTISAIGTSANGHMLLAGMQDGKVLQWVLSGDEIGTKKQQTARLRGAVTAIATNTDGGSGVAIDDKALQIWPVGPRTASFRIPAGQRPTAVGVSPSGRFTVVTTEVAQGELPPELMLLDRATGRTSEITLRDLGPYPDSIAFPSNNQIVVFDGGYGTWERISIPMMKYIDGTRMGLFGVHDYAAALSSDGRFFTYTNAGPVLPLWTTRGLPELEHPSLVAQARGTSPVALALSADGSRAAMADDSTIYVSRTVAPGRRSGAPITLSGAGQISRGRLSFLGNDDNQLVSASGDLLTLWDARQYSRIGTEQKAVIPIGCDACGEPRIAFEPHGQYVAIGGGDGSEPTLSVEKIGYPGTSKLLTKTSPTSDSSATPPLWESSGKGIIQVNSQDDSAQIWSPSSGNKLGTWPAPPDPSQLSDPASLLELTPDGRRVVEVDASGTVKIRDSAVGKVLRAVRGPADMAPNADGQAGLPQDDTALNSDATYAAVIDSNSADIYVSAIDTGHTQVIHEADVAGIAFIRDSLLIQRQAGTLEIWDASGSRRLDTIQGTPEAVIGPVADGSNTIAETDPSGTVQLIDYPSGYLLGTLTLPMGANSIASTGLGFSPDGQQLITATAASGSGDTGEMVDWKINAGAWIRIACDSAGHNITAGQWMQYMGTSAPPDLHCTQ